MACGMRSMEDLLVDMIEAPEFVHELMRFITDSRKEYTQQSRKFLGKVEIRNACSENSLANDEVSIPIVSPQLYEELIFPYEDELSEFFGGVNWWHSCGNKTPLVSVIKKMSRSIAFMDFALWADDLRTGVRDLGGAISLHVRPSSGDISERSEEIIKNHVQGIMCMCKGQNFAFRLDSFQPDNAKEADVNTMKRYLSIVKRVGKENLAYTDD